MWYLSWTLYFPHGWLKSVSFPLINYNLKHHGFQWILWVYPEKSSNLRVVWGPFLARRSKKRKQLLGSEKMCLYLGEVGAVALGRGMQILPAYSPAGRKPQEWKPQPVSSQLLSPSSEHWPNPTEERGQAVQVMSSTQASLQGTGQGGGGWRGNWKQKWGRSAQQDHTILLTHPWVPSV